MTESSSPSEQTFTKFCLAFYALEGSEPLCLDFQDTYKGNVVLLLWALWLDVSGVSFNERLWALGASAMTWRSKLTAVLRCIRRALPKRHWLGVLRQIIAQQELRSELNAMTQLEVIHTRETPKQDTEGGFLMHYLSSCHATVLGDDLRRNARLWRAMADQ